MSTSSFIRLLAALLFIIATVPGLYVGALMVQTFDLPFFLFIAPASACLAVAGYFLTSAEELL